MNGIRDLFSAPAFVAAQTFSLRYGSRVRRLSYWLAQRKGFSYLAQSDPIGFLLQGSFETFQRFGFALAPQPKCSVMDRRKAPRSRGVGHRDRLFRRAMRTNPRRISANWLASDVEWPFPAKAGKVLAQGGVSAENDFLPAVLEDVAVVAAMRIAPPTGAPVIYFEGLDTQRSFVCCSAQLSLS